MNNNVLNDKLGEGGTATGANKHLTIKVPSTTVDRINKNVSNFRRGACLSRRKMKLKPRFYGRNKALSALAARVDVLSVAETITSTSILKFLSKTKTKLYVLKIIE